MNAAPKRVLQVVRAMNPGGVENWLMHVLRRLDSHVLEMDFLVHTEEPAAYDREIAASGARLLRCGVSWRSPFYRVALRSLLSRRPYDVVHSHVHFFSGILLGMARTLGTPVRVAHSHSDTSRQDSAASWPRRRYLHWAQAGIEHHATHWLAASQSAGSALFGGRWGVDPRSQVLHCGIDLELFRQPEKRDGMRQSLGIASGDLVIGHVGRLDTPKNHSFLLKVAAEASACLPRLRLVLVGEGPARPLIEQQLRASGLEGRAIVLGRRTDVADLLSAMDVFVFPSLWEGLPLAVIEAQAAGLPCLISDVISSEAVVAPELVRRLSLAAGASAWAEALRELARRLPARRKDAVACLEHTDFNVERSVKTLYAHYGV